MKDVVKNLMLEKRADTVIDNWVIPYGKSAARSFYDFATEDRSQQINDAIKGSVKGVKNDISTWFQENPHATGKDVHKAVKDKFFPSVQPNAIVNPDDVAAAEDARLVKDALQDAHNRISAAKAYAEEQQEHADWLANTTANASKMTPAEINARSQNAITAWHNPEALKPNVAESTPVEATQTATDSAKVAPNLTQLMHDNAELAGAGIGGLAGAGLGAYLGGKNNRGLGATIGGLGGAAVGGVAGHLLKNASIYAPTLTAKYAAESTIERRELPKQNKMDILYYPDVGKHALVAGALAGVGNLSPTTGIGTGLGVYTGGKLGRGIGATLGMPNVGAVLGETLGGAAGYYAGHRLAE